MLLLDILDTKKTRIEKILKTTLNFLQTIQFINKGGCGYASLVIQKTLKDYEIKSEIVYLYRSLDSAYMTNESSLKTKGDKFSSCAHAVVKAGRYYIDSTGILNVDEYFCKLVLTTEQVKLSLRNKSHWNETFNRKENVPRLVEIFGIEI